MSAAPPQKGPSPGNLFAAAAIVLAILAGASLWIFYFVLSPSDSQTIRIDNPAPLEIAPHQGISVSGFVVDSEGRPLPRAYVTTRTQWYGNQDDSPHATTDARGHFEIWGQQAGASVTLTATLAEHAPAMAYTKVAAAMRPVKIVLGHGRTIQGRVTDKSGTPIAGADVRLNQWMNVFIANARPVTTDAKGNYTLKNIPMEQIAVQADKEGYSGDYQRVGDRSTDVVNFTMSPLITMQGHVVDAVTGKAIGQFTLLTGANWSAGQPPNFPRFNLHKFRGGQYKETLRGRQRVLPSRGGQGISPGDLAGAFAIGHAGLRIAPGA